MKKLLSVICSSVISTVSFACFPVYTETTASDVKDYHYFSSMSDEKVYEEYAAAFNIDETVINNGIIEKDYISSMLYSLNYGIAASKFVCQSSDLSDTQMEKLLEESPEYFGYPENYSELSANDSIITGDAGMFFYINAPYSFGTVSEKDEYKTIYSEKDIYNIMRTMLILINSEFYSDYELSVSIDRSVGYFPVVYGDVTLDAIVDINDAVYLASHSANKDKYPLYYEISDSADVYQHGDGIGLGDAVSIQKYLARQISSLPESSMTAE